MRGINRRMQSSAVDYLSAIADRKPINLSTCFLLLWIISSSVLQAHGYFMYDSKAVLDGCHEYWTFQNRERIPLLFQMTVCVDVRVTSPGHWLAFSYISPRSPRYDLALEGDPHSLYAWLLGVRHRFPVELQLQRWHRLCLRRDSLRNTFSLEVEGSAEAHRRTVIARVIPPHGALTLGCRPEDATPGTTRGKVELYLFRMWGDVGQHEKCEDGTVAGWESRLWSITHSRTRVRDDLLYCGKRRRKRSNSGTTTNGAREFASTPATTSDRSTTTPPPLTTPPRTTQTSHVGTISATVPTAKATTASTLTPTSKKITAASTTSKETQHPHGGQGSSPSPFTASSQQTGTEGVNSTYAHPSTHPTFSPSSPSPTMTFDPENTATTAFTVADPTPTEGSQNTSHSTYPHMTATTEPKQVTGTTSVTTLPATTPRYSTNSTTSPTSRTLMASHSTADQWSTPDTGQIVMQCNFSQFCSNTTSHYWMLVSVNVSRGMKTEADIKAWFSLLNYSITHDESTEVNCADKTNIRRTNCTVLLQLSKPMSTCDLRHLLQERGDGDDIHVTILGQVERVGKNLCIDEDLLPPGGGFVRCTYPVHFDGMCVSEAEESVNVTCLYMNSEYVPATSIDPEIDSCTHKQQDQCDCEAFCTKKDAYYYALRLNITSPTINLTDIQDMIFKNSSDCDSDRDQGVCENITQAFSHFREIHLECHGTETRLHSCMVALMLDEELSVCVVSRVMAGMLYRNKGVYYDGLLRRMAICGGNTSTNVTLLDSTLTWFSSSHSASDFCDAMKRSPLTCKSGETKAVLLGESCKRPEWPRNYGNPVTPPITNPADFTTSPVPMTTQGSSTTDLPQAPTQFIALPGSVNISHNNFTTAWQNPTEFNTTTMLPQTSHFDATSAQNTTEFYTTELPNTSHLNITSAQNTTQFNTITELPHTSHFNTTSAQNTTQFNTATELPHTSHFNTTSAQNTTQFNTAVELPHTSHLNATSAQSTTEFYSTTELPLTSHLNTTSAQNTTQFNTTTELPHTSHFNTTLAQNSTQFNTAVELPHTSHLNATSAQNTTEFYTTDLPHTSYLNSTLAQNTTQFNTTTELPHISHFDTLSTQNTTEFNTTAELPHTSSFNTTSAQNTTEFNTTTELPHTSSFNTTSAQNTTEFNATTELPHTSSFNTTSAQNTTEFNTTTELPHTSSFNTTSAQKTTEFNTTTELPHTSSFNTTSAQNITEFNTTTLQQTDTQFYTTMLPPNATQFNTTHVPQNTTQFTISTRNITPFNSTAVWGNNTIINTTTPSFTKPINSTTTRTTTWNSTDFDMTPLPLNTTQMYTPTNESIQNRTYINTTAFPTNATQSVTTYTPLNSTDFTTPVVLPTSSPNITTLSPQLSTTESFTAPPSHLNITGDYNRTTISPATTAATFQSTSSLPTTEEVSSTNAGTNESVSMTSPVLDHTVALLTTPAQIPTTQHKNVTVLPVAPDRTTTTTLSPTAAAEGTLKGSTQALPKPTKVGPVHPNATVPSEAKTTTTTTTTTTTAAKPPVVKPSTETTTTTTTTTTTSITTATTLSPGTQANQLLNQTKDVSSLNSSQVADLVNQLESLLSSPTVSLETGRAVLSVIGNLLNASASTIGSSSNKLIKAVDTLSLKLVVEQESVMIEANSLVLSVTKIDSASFDGGSFTISSSSNKQSTKTTVRSRRSVRESTLGEKDMGMVTLPSTLTDNLSPQQLEEISRVQFNFFAKTTFFQDKALDQRLLNSRVLSASVSNLSISGLSEGVEIILRNDQPVPENATAVCVFWDFSKNGGSGGWNSEGCFVKNTTTKNETVCSCNHLTSFAILLDLSREGITDRVQATILSFITYIGCGISAIFLGVTLLSYLSFEKIRRDIPSKILIQLCLALLMLNLVFLMDSWLALYPDAVGLCISTAFFLHYFLLASFTWMGLEALHMYLAIVKVFNSYMSRYMLKFSLMGWGIPLPVVIIVIAVDKNNYGLVTYGKYSDGTTDDFCWLKNDTAFYVGVVAYFCLVFVLNLVMFVVVMVQLNRVKRQNPHNNQHRSSLHDLRSVAGLTFLLGLTWGFAFFAWGPVNLAFMYLFSIFNSLQGLFIFVFHCALKDNVRRQWRIYLCCGKLRLAENSDWSRTATQNNTKKSSLATTSSVHSSNSALTQRASRNSSVTGDALEPSNGIRSPFEDSVITALEDSNGDVILNEINNHYSSRRQQ